MEPIEKLNGKRVTFDAAGPPDPIEGGEAFFEIVDTVEDGQSQSSSPDEGINEGEEPLPVLQKPLEEVQKPLFQKSSAISVSAFSIPSDEGGRGKDKERSAYADLAISKLVKEEKKRMKIHSPRINKSYNKVAPQAEEEEYPMDEPPRIQPTGGTSLVPKSNADYYCDPPATLIIQSFKARTSAFVNSDDLSDISPTQNNTDDEKSHTTVPSECDLAINTDDEKINTTVPTECDIAIVPVFDEEKSYKQDETSYTEKCHTENESVDALEAGVEGKTEEPPKPLENKKMTLTYSILAILLGIFVVLGTVYLVVYILQYLNGNDDELIIIGGGNQTGSDSSKDFVGMMPTTAMDTYIPGCVFDNYTMPHVRAQCLCNDEIEVLTQDVREKYYRLKILFVAMNVSNVGEISDQSCNPTNQAIVWLATTYSLDRADLIQKYVMSLLFLKTNGEQWANQENWMEDEDVCNWAGLACNDASRVTSIYLDGNGLKGSFPWELTLLGSLESLSLGSNGLTGTVPDTMFALPNLKDLSVPINSLEGTLSSSIGVASKLETLRLDMNWFHGKIPTEIGQATNMRKLNIGNNHLGGEIPVELYKLTGLEKLNLENNNLITGRLASEISQLTNLDALSIAGTGIRSRIPTEIGFLSRLQVSPLFRSLLHFLHTTMIHLITLDCFAMHMLDAADFEARKNVSVR